MRKTRYAPEQIAWRSAQTFSRWKKKVAGMGVAEVLKRLAPERRLPKIMWVDNGPEFTSKVLDRWAYLNGVQLDFSRPGKPRDNACIEAVNARVRQECLNAHWLLSREDARAKIETWRSHDNGDLGFFWKRAQSPSWRSLSGSHRRAAQECKIGIFA